jgi:hypothetical protein
MTTEPIKKHLRIILEKMFEGTGIPYSDEYVKTNDWYLNYKWTEDQENEFTDWLADYLYNNSDARKELMALSNKSKAACMKAAIQFSSFFGWTTSEKRKQD